MDTHYTYASLRGGLIAHIYAPPELDAPETLELPSAHPGRKPVTFIRVSDRPLVCGAVYGVKGSCTSAECHRRELGKCQCGRHQTVAITPNDAAALAAAQTD